MTAALKEFGAALAREIGNESLAKFAKETAGISKSDVRAFIAGEKVPDKLTIKKIVHCFPILMQFEGDLRRAATVAKPEKAKKHKPPPRSETRLRAVRQPRIAAEAYKPRVEIVTQHAPPPEPLKHTPFVQALRKTRGEMLTELAGTVKRRVGELTAEDYDFTIRTDSATQQLIVKLRVEEKGAEDLVDSGCYLTVSPRGSAELVVFCKAMTSGAVDVRVTGVVKLLEIAVELEKAVAGRRFE